MAARTRSEKIFLFDDIINLDGNAGFETNAERGYRRK